MDRVEEVAGVLAEAGVQSLTRDSGEILEARKTDLPGVLRSLSSGVLNAPGLRIAVDDAVIVIETDDASIADSLQAERGG